MILHTIKMRHINGFQTYSERSHSSLTHNLYWTDFEYFWFLPLCSRVYYISLAYYAFVDIWLSPLILFLPEIFRLVFHSTQSIDVCWKMRTEWQRYLRKIDSMCFLPIVNVEMLYTRNDRPTARIKFAVHATTIFERLHTYIGEEAKIQEILWK